MSKFENASTCDLAFVVMIDVWLHIIKDKSFSPQAQISGTRRDESKKDKCNMEFKCETVMDGVKGDIKIKRGVLAGCGT